LAKPYKIIKRKKEFKMAKKENTGKYTYIMFCEDITALLDGTLDLTEELYQKMTEKNADLLSSQTKKKEYNTNNPKKSANKGASAKTLEIAANIIEAIKKNNNNPVDTEDINRILKKEYKPLNIANAAKYAEGVIGTKIIKEKIGKDGLRKQGSYAAYMFGTVEIPPTDEE